MTDLKNIYFSDKCERPELCKIGFTEQTCFTRCRNADYTITHAFEDANLTRADLQFIEAWIRCQFKKKYEQIGDDYFVVNRQKKTAEKLFIQCVKQAYKMLGKEMYYVDEFIGEVSGKYFY